jgi:diguanylate cyclase
MSHTASTAGSIKQVNSLIRMIHRIRLSGSVMGFAIIAAHMVGKDYSWLIWGLLALQFFVYPHLIHWRTRQASNPMRAELTNFLTDSFLLGLWSASLGYPLWITFTLFTCNVVSIILYHSTRGAAQAVVIFFLGGLLWVALTNQPIDLHTDWPATVLSVVGLTIFLLMVTNMTYHRNLKLRDTREQLLKSEHALNAANRALQQQLGEIHILQARLSEQANRDPLTGLYNRRYLDSTLERELARCKREGQPLSLVLIDLDHFKQINDTYGHQAGDEVLKQLADMLNAQARAADVACRYGGEEFLLLLPDMPQDIALERVEQWRATFAAMTIAFGEFRMQATLSIGIATYPGHGTSPTELIRRADRALYQAKTAGRNRVVLSGTETPVPSA